MKNHWLNTRWLNEIAPDSYWNNLTIENRRLKAIWSRDAQQDVRAIYNLEAGRQLDNMVSSEMFETIISG